MIILTLPIALLSACCIAVGAAVLLGICRKSPFRPSRRLQAETRQSVFLLVARAKELKS